jgi:Integrase core domain
MLSRPILDSGERCVVEGGTCKRRQVAAGLIYGQVKKNYRRRKLVRVTHVMRLGTEAALEATLLGPGLTGRLNTAYIERVNLTVRHGIAALARRTWATAQQSPHLLAHLEWWRAYYHFVRPHASLRVRLVQPRERGGNRLAQRYRQRTPAMAAGRTHRRWNEVGGRRVALRYVFNRPFPNRTGTFQCIRLSRSET